MTTSDSVPTAQKHAEPQCNNETKLAVQNGGCAWLPNQFMIVIPGLLHVDML